MCYFTKHEVRQWLGQILFTPLFYFFTWRYILLIFFMGILYRQNWGQLFFLVCLRVSKITVIPYHPFRTAWDQGLRAPPCLLNTENVALYELIFTRETQAIRVLMRHHCCSLYDPFRSWAKSILEEQEFWIRARSSEHQASLYWVRREGLKPDGCC